MSHTTTIDEVVFKDVEALKSAVQLLKKRGVACSLENKSKPRAFYADQLPVADYVLKLSDSPYDVGFYMDDKKKGYVAKTDFYAGHVARVLGAKTSQGESSTQAALGKLYQSYAVAATQRQAAKQGYKCRTVTKPDGSMQLILTGMKG